MWGEVWGVGLEPHHLAVDGVAAIPERLQQDDVLLSPGILLRSVTLTITYYEYSCTWYLDSSGVVADHRE